jgi:hypothetical protein
MEVCRYFYINKVLNVLVSLLDDPFIELRMYTSHLLALISLNDSEKSNVHTFNCSVASDQPMLNAPSPYSHFLRQYKGFLWDAKKDNILEERSFGYWIYYLTKHQFTGCKLLNTPTVLQHSSQFIRNILPFLLNPTCEKYNSIVILMWGFLYGTGRNPKEPTFQRQFQKNVPPCEASFLELALPLLFFLRKCEYLEVRKSVLELCFDFVYMENQSHFDSEVGSIDYKATRVLYSIVVGRMDIPDSTFKAIDSVDEEKEMLELGAKIIDYGIRMHSICFFKDISGADLEKHVSKRPKNFKPAYLNYDRPLDGILSDIPITKPSEPQYSVLKSMREQYLQNIDKNSLISPLRNNTTPNPTNFKTDPKITQNLIPKKEFPLENISNIHMDNAKDHSAEILPELPKYNSHYSKKESTSDIVSLRGSQFSGNTSDKVTSKRQLGKLCKDWQNTTDVPSASSSPMYGGTVNCIPDEPLYLKQFESGSSFIDTRMVSNRSELKIDLITEKNGPMHFVKDGELLETHPSNAEENKFPKSSAQKSHFDIMSNTGFHSTKCIDKDILETTLENIQKYVEQNSTHQSINQINTKKKPKSFHPTIANKSHDSTVPKECSERITKQIPRFVSEQSDICPSIENEKNKSEKSASPKTKIPKKHMLAEQAHIVKDNQIASTESNYPNAKTGILTAYTLPIKDSELFSGIPVIPLYSESGTKPNGNMNFGNENPHITIQNNSENLSSFDLNQDSFVQLVQSEIKRLSAVANLPNQTLNAKDSHDLERGSEFEKVAANKILDEPLDNCLRSDTYLSDKSNDFKGDVGRFKVISLQGSPLKTNTENEMNYWDAQKQFETEETTPRNVLDDVVSKFPFAREYNEEVKIFHDADDKNETCNELYQNNHHPEKVNDRNEIIVEAHVKTTPIFDVDEPAVVPSTNSQNIQFKTNNMLPQDQSMNIEEITPINSICKQSADVDEFLIKHTIPQSQPPAEVTTFENNPENDFFSSVSIQGNRND